MLITIDKDEILNILNDLFDQVKNHSPETSGLVVNDKGEVAFSLNEEEVLKMLETEMNNVPNHDVEASSFVVSDTGAITCELLFGQTDPNPITPEGSDIATLPIAESA